MWLDGWLWCTDCVFEVTKSEQMVLRTLKLLLSVKCEREKSFKGLNKHWATGFQHFTPIMECRLKFWINWTSNLILFLILILIPLFEFMCIWVPFFSIKKESCNICLLQFFSEGYCSNDVHLPEKVQANKNTINMQRCIDFKIHRR